MKLVTLHSYSLVSNIARDLKLEVIRLPYLGTFLDGETRIHSNKRFDGEEVLFVQSTYPYPDRKLLEICFLADMMKSQLGAKKVIAVIPYLAYMRQDKDFSRAEGMGYDAVCARTVLSVLRACDIDKLYVVDVHSDKLLKDFYPFAENLDPSKLFADYIAREIENPFIVAPDDNAEIKASRIAGCLGIEWLSLKKRRDVRTGEVKVEDLSGLRAENAVIVDDIIATGNTMAESARVLREAGAKNIIALCTHALMVGEAERRLRKEGVSKIVSTDSLESRFSQISLAPLISQLFKV